MALTLDQALQKGIEAHKAGKVQEADRYYAAILKANPKHPDANHNMGVLAVGVGHVQEALPFFKIALEVNPNIAQYWLSYVDALIKLGRITDAKAVFAQAKNKGAMGDGFDQNRNKNHSLFFFNVPAPIYNGEYSTEVNGDVTRAIKLFNTLLQKTVLDYDFKIIDVYKFTIGKNGFSNNSFHIDDYHLSSNAIREIEKQIGTFL